MYVCMYVYMHVCLLNTRYSRTEYTTAPDGQKLLHGIQEITPPVRQGFSMPKRFAQITPNILLHLNAEITPRSAHPVQRFPLFRAPLSVEEITYGELKYNIIPIIHT